jgi:hypothetical protein
MPGNRRRPLRHSWPEGRIAATLDGWGRLSGRDWHIRCYFWHQVGESAIKRTERWEAV